MALNPGCRIGNASTNSSAALDLTSEFLAWKGERSFRIQRADRQRRQRRVPQAMLLVSPHRHVPIYMLQTTVAFKLTKLVRPSSSEAKLPAPCRQRRLTNVKLTKLVRPSLNEAKLPAPCRQRRFPTSKSTVSWRISHVLPPDQSHLR